jgi:hypothetical protein
MPSIKSIDQMWPKFLTFFPKILQKKEKEEYCSKLFPFLFSYFGKTFGTKKLMVDIGSKKSKRIHSKKSTMWTIFL